MTMNPKLLEYIRTDNLMKFYKSREWRELRLKVLKRDNHECQMCKRKGKYRKADCVHHIKEVKDFPMLALSFNNLMCLCNQCHNEVHDRLKDAVRNPKPKKMEFTNEERW